MRLIEKFSLMNNEARGSVLDGMASCDHICRIHCHMKIIVEYRK